MGTVYIGRKLPCKVLHTRPWFDLVPYFETTGVLVARLDDGLWAIYRWGVKPGWTLVPDAEWERYSQTVRPELPHKGWVIIESMVTVGGQTCAYPITQDSTVRILNQLLHAGHHLPLFHVPREERVFVEA